MRDDIKFWHMLCLAILLTGGVLASEGCKQKVSEEETIETTTPKEMTIKVIFESGAMDTLNVTVTGKLQLDDLGRLIDSQGEFLKYRILSRQVVSYTVLKEKEHG